MTEEEKRAKEAAEQINQKLDTLEKSLGDKVDADILATKMDEIKADISKMAEKEYAEKMQEQLDSIEGKIEGIAEGQRKNYDPEQQIEKQLKTDEFQSYAKGQTTGKHIFEVKADTLTTSNSFTETNSKIIPAYRESEIGKDPRRPFILQNLVRRGVVGQTDYIDWFERTAETTGTANTAEAAAYGQSDVSWTSYKLPIEDITDYIVVSRRKLADTVWVRGEIMDVLGFNIPHKLDGDMFDGDGTSNAIYGYLGGGAYNAAKTFSLPANSDPISNANIYHVLMRAIEQVELGNTSNTKATGFNVNAVILHNSDWYNLLALKDGNDNSVRLAGLTFDNTGTLRLFGIPIYKTQRITAGTYLVLDGSAGKLYIRENTTIEMWDQNASDPIQGKVTITAVTRVCFVVQNAKTYGAVTGTFAAGIPLVEAGS